MIRRLLASILVLALSLPPPAYALRAAGLEENAAYEEVAEALAKERIGIIPVPGTDPTPLEALAIPDRLERTLGVPIDPVRDVLGAFPNSVVAVTELASTRVALTVFSYTDDLQATPQALTGQVAAALQKGWTGRGGDGDADLAP